MGGHASRPKVAKSGKIFSVHLKGGGRGRYGRKHIFRVFSQPGLDHLLTPIATRMGLRGPFSNHPATTRGITSAFVKAPCACGGRWPPMPHLPLHHHRGVSPSASWAAMAMSTASVAVISIRPPLPHH
eukprot:3865533-Prymnesium_polylepis.1